LWNPINLINQTLPTAYQLVNSSQSASIMLRHTFKYIGVISACCVCSAGGYMMQKRNVYQQGEHMVYTGETYYPDNKINVQTCSNIQNETIIVKRMCVDPASVCAQGQSGVQGMDIPKPKINIDDLKHCSLPEITIASAWMKDSTTVNFKFNSLDDLLQKLKNDGIAVPGTPGSIGYSDIHTVHIENIRTPEMMRGILDILEPYSCIKSVVLSNVVDCGDFMQTLGEFRQLSNLEINANINIDDVGCIKSLRELRLGFAFTNDITNLSKINNIELTIILSRFYDRHVNTELFEIKQDHRNTVCTCGNLIVQPYCRKAYNYRNMH